MPVSLDRVSGAWRRISAGWTRERVAFGIGAGLTFLQVFFCAVIPLVECQLGVLTTTIGLMTAPLVTGRGK